MTTTSGTDDAARVPYRGMASKKVKSYQQTRGPGTQNSHFARRENGNNDDFGLRRLVTPENVFAKKWYTSIVENVSTSFPLRDVVGLGIPAIPQSEKGGQKQILETYTKTKKIATAQATGYVTPAIYPKTNLKFSS